MSLLFSMCANNILLAKTFHEINLSGITPGTPFLVWDLQGINLLVRDFCAKFHTNQSKHLLRFLDTQARTLHTQTLIVAKLTAQLYLPQGIFILFLAKNLANIKLCTFINLEIRNKQK